MVRLFVCGLCRFVSHIKMPVSKMITKSRVLRPTRNLPTDMPPLADCAAPINQRCKLSIALKKGNFSLCPFTSPVY